jgi:hypothetical protein
MTHAEELERLVELHRNGDLTDEEFASEKKRLIEASDTSSPVKAATPPAPHPKPDPVSVENNKRFNRRLLLGIGIFFAALIIISSIVGQNSSPPPVVESDVYFAACAIVKNYLKAPSSADFVFHDDSRVIIKHNSDGSWEVLAPFQSENSFGVKLANAFDITIRKNGDNWVAVAPPTFDQ